MSTKVFGLQPPTQEELRSLPSSDHVNQWECAAMRPATVRIVFHYPFIQEEESETFSAGAIQFRLGKNSRRLFEITFHVNPAAIGVSRPVEKREVNRVFRELQVALQRLIDAQRPLGAKINYRLACQKLDLDESSDATPGWLRDALQNLRDKPRTSQP